MRVAFAVRFAALMAMAVTAVYLDANRVDLTYNLNVNQYAALNVSVVAVLERFLNYLDDWYAVGSYTMADSRCAVVLTNIQRARFFCTTERSRPSSVAYRDRSDAGGSGDPDSFRIEIRLCSHSRPAVLDY